MFGSESMTSSVAASRTAAGGEVQASSLGSRRDAHAAFESRGGRRVSLRAVAAVSVLVCAAAFLGDSVALGATAAAVPAATFRDPVNDVRAGDVDLRAISVGKQKGALVVRFTVRKPITDN